jgi:hypothetical protein
MFGTTSPPKVPAGKVDDGMTARHTNAATIIFLSMWENMQNRCQANGGGFSKSHKAHNASFKGFPTAETTSWTCQ